MMEQKPVATWSNGKLNWHVVNDQGEGCLLFTADQLKAEREKTIQKCLKIAEEYRNSNYEDAGNVIYKNILALLSNHEEEPE